MRKFIYFFCLIFFSTFCISAKTVKTGYYIDSGDFMSGFGPEDPKDGYAYEYLQTIASYTGWEYEYVYGNWNELYDKLLTGEIDILTDVSYNPEREKNILFPELTMGTETYYLYCVNPDTQIDAGNYSTFEGKRLALKHDAFQYSVFKKWQKIHNLNFKITEFDHDADLTEAFANKEFDLFLDIDTNAEKNWNPVAKVGESDFYTVVTKSRPDLLAELNSALNEIYVTNPYFCKNLWVQHFKNIPLSKELTTNEIKWLNNRNKIVIGGLTDDFPFSSFDKNLQRYEGLSHYLMNYLMISFGIRNISLEYKHYENYTQLTEALKNGEIDLAFPYIYDLYEAEKQNISLSAPITELSTSYIFNQNASTKFMEKIAVLKDRRSLRLIKKFYPDSECIEFDSQEKCINAVLSGKVSGTVFNNYRTTNSLHGRQKYKHLRFFELPNRMRLAFATNKDSTCLISILNKLIASIPKTELSSVLSEYSIKSKKYEFSEFLQDYATIIIGTIIFITLILLALFASLDKIAELINYDTLTHLLNRRNLLRYVNNSIERANSKNEPFCLLLFDLDNFKHINDTYGHDCGDEVLKMAARVIFKGVKSKDYVFRWGGEEILVLLKTDYEMSMKIAERIRAEIEYQTIEYNEHQIKITATVGVAPYTPGSTPEKLFAIADKNLYIGKRNGKNRVVGHNS